jgi:Nuclease-related domain
MITKMVNIVLALLFAIISSLTCLHGIYTPNVKVIITAITLFFIMAELALYYILGRLMARNRANQTDSLRSQSGTALCDDESTLPELLSRMDPEWIVLKNFYRQGISADFVIIGPTGIHLVVVKDVRGELIKINDFLLLNNTRSINDFINVAKNHATSLQRDFRSFDKSINIIKPILCFSRARLSKGSSGLQDGVFVVSPESIIAAITDDTSILDSFHVYGIYTFLSRNSSFQKLSPHNPFRNCFIAPEQDDSEQENALRLGGSQEGVSYQGMIGASH